MVSALLTAVVTACASSAVPTSTTAQPALRLEQVANLSAPLHVAAPRSEPNRVYVVEQDGAIRVLQGRRVRTFLDISSRVRSGGEQGLLSVAFHPQYARNRRFYVNYTDVNGHTRVVEYRSNGTRALPGTARQLLFVRQPYANHNGGQLAFGPDGHLYVGMGDGGSGGDPQNRAQNLGDRLGKLVRLNVDRRGARWEIVGYGLRNPWRFSFDRANGDLYIGDVGQNAWEEVDFTSRNSPGLENYGWDVYEGRAIYERKEVNPAGRLVPPIHVYANGGGECSVTGGFVYRGRAVPGLRGRYVFGDFCSGNIWTLRVANGEAVDVRRERIRVINLSSFGEDARGELYATSLAGRVFRIVG
jgi:glucose/arabinose dehydrogenase